MVHKSGLSRGVVFPQGGERPMKQALVPRHSGLSREVVSGQGGLSRGRLLYIYQQKYNVNQLLYMV